MSNKSRRRPPIPPRPQVIPEQLRQQLGQQLGQTPRILDRQQCIEFAGMLGGNLERLLNNKKQLPWLSASMEKRSDGFSLHVQVVQPTDDNDATIIPMQP